MDAATDFKFGLADYAVVISMLLLSNLIGVYYSFFNKQDTFTKYMLGGKKMGVFPVSMSIVASFISGITLIGLPLETYLYGSQFLAFNFSIVTVALVMGAFFIPVYHQLQLNSLFEYLEMRFNSSVRVLATLAFSLSLILFLPAVIYVPAVAFNQVTGVPVYIMTPIICGSCCFYTAFGGLKAVLWTDALQNISTFLAVAFVSILGCYRVGGLTEIWRINQEGSRLELFNLDPNPFARNTLWTVSISAFFIFFQNLSNPGSVQRFLSVPSVKKARMVLFWSCVGFYIISDLCVFMGLLLFARYHQCDPLAAGVIKSPTQLVPLYMTEIGRDYPGLAGLFISGVLSAALSTMSSLLNTVGGTLYKDIMEVFFPKVEHSDATQSKLIKTIVIVLSLICAALVAVVDKLGPVFQVAVSILGLINGAILSLFILGMCVPHANVKGAIAGTTVSIVLTSWIVGSAQYYVLTGKLKFPGKKTSIDKCPADVLEHYNATPSLLYSYTGVGTPVVADSTVPLIYQLSYNYYIVLGTLSAVVVGVVVSYLTGSPKPTSLNPELFTPWVHRFLPQTVRPDKTEYILGAVKEPVTELQGMVKNFKTNSVVNR